MAWGRTSAPCNKLLTGLIGLIFDVIEVLLLSDQSEVQLALIINFL